MRTRVVRFAVLGLAIMAAAITASAATGHKAAAGGTLANADLAGVAHSPRRLQAYVPTSARHLALRVAAAHARARAHAQARAHARARTIARVQGQAQTESANVPASSPSPTPSSPTPSSSLRFEWPIEGTITTPFIPSGPQRHDGIDIGDLHSLTVIAAHAGQVIHVGYTVGFEGYGNIVDVVVAPGVETIYAHLSAMNVQIGQQVSEGEVLGTAGCTGMCSGTHLHFEVRENGTPVDPLQFLP